MDLGAFSVIGLFQGMFEKNMFTSTLADVRELQRKLKAQGMTFVSDADEKTRTRSRSISTSESAARHTGPPSDPKRTKS